MDTNSGTPFPCAGNGPNYYIGRLGGGTTAGGGGFDTATANAVGPLYTFSYWDLEGPNVRPSGTTPNQWGIDQANYYITAWDNASNVDGSTMFADIEPGNPGWDTTQTSTAYADNRAVLEGFLSTLKGYQGGGTFQPGVYIGISFWDEYFGSSYTSSTPFVFWLAGTDCPNSCAAAADQFNTSHANESRGGYKVMIWQYVVSYDPQTGTGCPNETKDLDITPYAGYQNGKWNPVVA